jgi:hypothetical protein
MNTPIRPKKINGLKNLVNQRAPSIHTRYCVQAYALNRDLLQEDGSLDDFYGIYVPLGSFATQEEADEEAKRLIEKTGYDCIFSAEYASPVPLTEIIPQGNTFHVPIDVTGKRIQKIDDDKYQREVQAYEDQQKREKEIEEETDNESNVDNIEYMKRNSFLAVKNYSKAQYHLENYNQAIKMYEERKANIQTHIAKHPKHKEEWLPFLKEKLEKRGEADLYNTIKIGFEKIQDDIYK